MEQALVAREGVPFTAIHAGGINGVGVAQKLRSAFKLFRGFAQAMGVLRRFKPHVVLLTGGFVGVPVSVAAWLRRVPSVVYLPDVEPGMAVKAMNRFAAKVATTTEASKPYVPAHKMVVTGYPVRTQFAAASRDAARAHFGINAGERVLLVFGGSKGARSINRAILASLDQVLALASVIHVTGTADWDEVRAKRDALPHEQQARYLAYPYLHDEMVLAMAAADLAVCRSGASTLGELPALGLPAVLIPYPHAWRYQKVNAQYLAQRGAAHVLEDQALADPQTGLVATVAGLFNSPNQLSGMRTSMKAIQTNHGAQNIANLLAEEAHYG